MTSNRFIYFILSAFIAGNLLIIFLQYNSAKNIHNLIIGNKNLLHELEVSSQLRELERDLLSVELKLRGTVATNDTSYLRGVDLQIAEAQALLDSLRKISDHDSTLRNINYLSSLANEKIALKNQLLDSFRKAGRLSPERFRVIMQRRDLSNAINNTSRKIYASRQRLLDSISDSTNTSGRKAQKVGIIMNIVVLISGAILFWYIISRIRRQNHLIRQLDASEKKVREVSMIKENFMANMSHEIRTPMNAILGFASLLKAKNRDPELTEFVDSIHHSGETLLTIIDDILDLSKIEAGMMRIESAPFSVRALIHSIETLFRRKMDEKGLHFSTAVDDSVPDTLSGDATRLTQILVNVIGNAVKFTPKGAIHVGVNNNGSAGDQVRIGFVISDTGIGIAKEKLAGIFERFRQAEASITRKYGGTGLGLSIVKDLVLMQGGEIAVESEPGSGTTFTFTIPYGIAAGQSPVLSASSTAGSEFPEARHIRILVVEDNVMNLKLLKHLLNEWMFSFHMANNGLEALENLQTSKYSLILMDIQMPGMDGYTVTREIRQQLKMDIPVIAMTAHAFAGEREKCLQSGMNEYISKPINGKELYRLITQFTGIASVRPTPYQIIDLQYMRGISEGDKEYEKTVTEEFIEAIPLDVSALESALRDKDTATLRQTAHNMKTNVSVMGLLEKLQSWLDVVEYEPFDEARFRQAILSIKTICLDALPEARHFYSTL